MSYSPSDVNTEALITDHPTVLLADQVNEAARTLIYLTRPSNCVMERSCDAAALVGSLAILADHLPQLLRHIGGWLEAKDTAGRLLIGGEPMRNTATGLTAVSCLNDAGVIAAGLGLLLHDSHNALCAVSDG